MSTALWFYVFWAAFTFAVGFGILFLGLLRPLLGRLPRRAWGLHSAAMAAHAFDPPRPSPPRQPLWRYLLKLPWGIVFLGALGPAMVGFGTAFSVASGIMCYRRLRPSCARLLRRRRVRFPRLWSYFVSPRLFLARAFALVLRFFRRSPLPNNALQRTEAGGRGFSAGGA